MRSGFILLSVFVFSVSSAQYKGQNIRVDSLKANAMILQSGELPLGWPQDTLRVVIDTVNSIAPKVNKLYTGDDDEGGILPPSMVRDSIRYAIENAVGGGIPMPDTTEQGGKFLRYNGTEETPFDWAVAGSGDTLGFATVGPERPAGALHATSSYRVKSIATDTIVGGTDTDFYGKKTIWWDRNAGLKAPSVNLGVIWLDTATTRIGDETWFKVNVMKMSSMYGGFAATNGMNFVVSPRRGNAAFNFSDLAFDFNNNDIMPFMTQIVPHQLLMVNRFTNFTPSGNPASPYTAQDDIGAIGANMSVNSHYAIQPAQVKAIDARVNIGGAMPWELGTIGYAANGSYTPALAISGHFELNNYARSEIPTAYGVRARISNAHNNDSTRYGFAAGFKFSQPFWSYGGYDTLYGAHFDDPKYGDVRAAIGLRDTGLIAWKWDTFLKRTGAGTLRLDTNLTAKNIRSDDTLQASKSVLVGNTTGRVGDTTPSIYLANTSGDANNRGVIQEYLNSLNLISQSNVGAATGTLVSLSTQRAAKGFPSRGALVVDTLQRVIIGQYSTPVSHRADSSLTVHPNQPMANTSANPVSDSLTGGGGHFYGGLQVDKGLNVTGTTATGNLRIENLGDGLLTTESGDVVVSAIVPNILPDTSGDAGKYLQYTGAGFDWVAETSVDSANFEKKNTIRQLFTSGLIDSVKTTDTLFLGAIYPAATVDTLRVDALGAVDVTMIVEMVDSLNQSSGQTPVCTTTVTNARKLISSFDEAALLNGKILRVRFTTVGTMPKQIIISVLGHH